MSSEPSRQMSGGGDNANEPEIEDLDALAPRSLSSRSPQATTPRSGGPVTVDALIALVHEVTSMKRELIAVKADVAAVNTRAQETQSPGNRPSESNADVAALHADLNAFKQSISEKIKEMLPDAEPEEAVLRDNFVEGGIEVYEFNESVWDALLFLGHIRGAYEAVDMTLLGLINLLIQGWFCALLLTLRLADLSDDVFRENLFDFIQWRIGVAHQAEYYDPLTNTSLAQRVCLQYGGTIESRRHQTDFTTSETYYNFDEKEHSLLQGPGLLMLALALWLALILKEVVNILGFARMVLALTLNGDGQSRLKKQKDGDIEILSMSKKRATFLLVCVMLPRIAIAMMLALVGTLYLRATFSVEEIILNAMALGFVLEIDELLFHFLPAAARYTLQHLQPVPLAINSMHVPKDTDSSRGASAGIAALLGALFERTRVLFVILIVIVISFRFTLIQDIQDSMKMSQLILCEGTSHFVFKQHPMTRVLVLGDTVNTRGDDELKLPVQDIPTVFDAVLQATGLCAELRENSDVEERLGLCRKDKGMWCEPCRRLLDLPSSESLFLNDTLTATLSLVSATPAEALASLECIDSYTSPNETWMREPIRELLSGTGSNITLDVCSEMKQHCLHASSAVRDVVRRYCPESCGCNDATVDTVETWYFHRIGCLPTCSAAIDEQMATLREDLVIGSKVCEDEDQGLSEDRWAHYVQDVQDELVKRGWLVPTTDGLGFKPAAQARASFAAATKADFTRFHSSLVHHSNQPHVSIDGCSIEEDKAIDLLAWARSMGSLCRWARVVQYVFNIDLCTNAALSRGFTPLEGLCPMSCRLGLCSEVNIPDSFDTDVFAWYNIMPWGKDAELNITCDRASLKCIEVDKMTKTEGWEGLTLRIINDSSSSNTTLYAGPMTVQWDGNVDRRAALDIVCLRPPSATHCYTIQFSEFSFQPRTGIRWRMTEIGTRQFLMSGGILTTAKVCGSDWVPDVGVPCKSGDTVTVMKPFAQMQIDDYRVEYPDEELPDDPADYELQGIGDGMFAHRKALFMGGYNGTAVTVEYAEIVFGSFKRELLAEIGKPDLHLGYDAPLEGVTIWPCDPSTSELLPDPISNGLSPLCNGTEHSMSCNAFVEEYHCISPVAYVAHWFDERGCSDLEGLSETATVADICPLSCISQQTVPPPTEDVFSMPQYYSYYHFKPIGQLRHECQCKFSLDRFYACQDEMGLTRVPFYEHDPYETPLEDFERFAEHVRSHTYCASVEMNFEERDDFPNLSKWCYTSQVCEGSRALDDPFNGDCAWRPASPEECAIDPPDYDYEIWGVDIPMPDEGVGPLD